MYFIESFVKFVISSLIVSEVTGWGLKGQEWYPGSRPQAYFHLLYLECNDIEHSRVYGELNLNYIGLKPLKLGNVKYNYLVKENKFFALYSKGQLKMELKGKPRRI